MPDRRQQMIDDMRELLFLLEAHPELPLPVCWGMQNAYVAKREELAACARALGGCKKTVIGEQFFTLQKMVGSARYLIHVDRDVMCERVQIGTREVTRPVMAKVSEETVEVPVYEWRCNESILRPPTETKAEQEAFAEQAGF